MGSVRAENPPSLPLPLGSKDSCFKAFGPICWEFPKIGGTVFWGPDNKDPTM